MIQNSVANTYLQCARKYYGSEKNVYRFNQTAFNYSTIKHLMQSSLRTPCINNIVNNLIYCVTNTLWVHLYLTASQLECTISLSRRWSKKPNTGLVASFHVLVLPMWQHLSLLPVTSSSRIEIHFHVHEHIFDETSHGPAQVRNSADSTQVDIAR